MTVYFLRHGQTQGNLERRYIGSTDEPLCPQGRRALAGIRAPAADVLYVSPMLRCRETAAALYPGMEATIILPGLRETDFGAFEGHTYDELKDNPAYCAWLGAAGEIPPPGGEGKAAVRRRVLDAFFSAVERHSEGDRLAFVVHGGTIMTLLEALEGSRQFYRWQAPNGGGFQCRWRDGALTEIKEI